MDDLSVYLDDEDIVETAAESNPHFCMGDQRRQPERGSVFSASSAEPSAV
jgi:hypothetical protein